MENAMINLPTDLLETEQFKAMPALEKDSYLDRMLKKILELNPNGITAPTIARSLGINATTIWRHLEKLTSTKYENNKIRKISSKTEDIVYRNECFKIIGILFSVYRELGGSLLEKHYQKSIAEAFRKEQIDFEEQVPVKLYFGEKLIGLFYIDFLIKLNGVKIILEIKKHENFGPKNIDQVKSYLKALSLKLGILANFTHSGVKFKRIVNLY